MAKSKKKTIETKHTDKNSHNVRINVLSEYPEAQNEALKELEITLRGMVKFAGKAKRTKDKKSRTVYIITLQRNIKQVSAVVTDLVKNLPL